MNQPQKDFALNSMHTLHDASKHMMIAHHIASHCESVADYHFETAMDYVKRLEMIIERYRDESTPSPTVGILVTGNPHHSGYIGDDEKRATKCPHCGNEDYDSECKCSVCKLWDCDDDHAKRFQFQEIIKNMSGEELDKAFSLVVTEVL